MSTFTVFRRAEESPGLCLTGIRYAVEQLAVRAGVSADISRRWHVDCSQPDAVILWVAPGAAKCVRFPRASQRTWEKIREGVFHTSTAQWACDHADENGPTPNFKIPFSSSPDTEVGALFVRESSDTYRCTVDLLSSIVLTLSRFEETLPAPRDSHGRYSAHGSIAWRDGFLHRPIVDEYGLALEEVLRALVPAWKPLERRLRVKLSHDVDEIGIPFSFRNSLAKTIRKCRPQLTLRDLVAPICGVDNSDQVYLKRLVQFSVERGLDAAIYWKSSRRGPYDTGYDLEDSRILALLHWTEASGAEMGIHPSYETFVSPNLLQHEVDKLRAVLGRKKLGGRQHYLRWNPQSWMRWDAVGLGYDSSVGFADYIGFRAGTCIPYRPWLWSEQRCAELVEIPLLATDATLRGYMKLKAGNALHCLSELVEQCRKVGGVFTLAWHNTALFDSRYSEMYRTLLDGLAGNAKYDWSTAAT